MTDDRIEEIENGAALSSDEARMPRGGPDGRALIDAQRAPARLAKVAEAS